MDLMGPMRTESKGEKRYVLVEVDDFSRYSSVCFLRENNETLKHLKSLFKRIQIEQGHPIIRIQSDRGREFDNTEVDLLCESKGIKHEYSAPRTPQQNGVAKRKNIVLQVIARVMLHIMIHLHIFGLKQLTLLVILPILFFLDLEQS